MKNNQSDEKDKISVKTSDENLGEVSGGNNYYLECRYNKSSSCPYFYLSFCPYIDRYGPDYCNKEA